jgi:hypothetical protein
MTASFWPMTKHYCHAYVNLQNIKHYWRTHHDVLIIYKSYTTRFPSGARGMGWLSHHINYKCHIFCADFQKSAASHCLAMCDLALTASKI